jgi:hypothetical protein
LTWQDREALRVAMALAFPTEAETMHVVQALAFPSDRLPAWAGLNAQDWWLQFFTVLDRGIIRHPYRGLLQAALGRYPTNNVFEDLANQHLTAPAADDQDLPSPSTPARHEPPAGAACHVIIRADDEEQRQVARTVLTDLQLGPFEIWSTAHAVSFQVNSADVETVRRALDATRLGWTLVPPGQPDYLLRDLFVTGPDGSRFRITDAPAAQSVRNVVTDVLEEYVGADDPSGPRPAVADHIGDNGKRRRLDMDDTLHDAGVRDGDHLGVGMEGRAGAIDSIQQQDALDRAYRDIIGFVQANPAVVVRANRLSRPTEYEIEFGQPSFGPPEAPGGEPYVIDRHAVLLQLGPEFPVQPPSAFWLSPIFHPNVFPTYDSEQSRQYPHMRGFVCLGMFAESWTPDTDFGNLLRLLIAMAGYRNYELFEFTGEWGSEGPQMRVNYFDRAAAAWTQAHQSEIVDIGGTPIGQGPTSPGRYSNDIVRLGPRP